MKTVLEEFAVVENASAYQIDDVLLVMLAGTTPTPCHTVTIERSLLSVEPPAFAARLSSDPHVVCSEVITPYEVSGAFHVGSRRDEVVVHHESGELTVPVKHPSIDDSGRAESWGGVLHRHPVTATGYSNTYDLAEAIRDAIEKLPPQEPTIPDWLSSYNLKSMCVEVGGIAGVDHLAVVLEG